MSKEGKEQRPRMVTFTKDETISASKLTRSSQKSLSDMMEKNQKVGIILNDEITYALLKVESLEEMMAQLHYYETLIDSLDDKTLAETMGTRLELSTDKWVEVPEEVSLMDWYRGEQ